MHMKIVGSTDSLGSRETKSAWWLLGVWDGKGERSSSHTKDSRPLTSLPERGNRSLQPERPDELGEVDMGSLASTDGAFPC
jgi:hypothetical protein